MMRLLFFFLSILIISCQSPKKVKPVAKEDETAVVKSLSTVVSSDTVVTSGPMEFIEYDKLKINGKINFHCSLKELYSVLGKPDSVRSTTELCITAFPGDTAHVAYFDESFVEISTDRAAISTVDFRSGKIRLVHPDFILDRNTTLESLRPYFPNAVRDASPVTSDIGDAIWIELQTDKTQTDFQWLLFFQKGKLVKIDLNTPC